MVLYCLVDVPIDVSLHGINECHCAFHLRFAETQILNNCKHVSGQAQGQCLYLLGCVLISQS